MRQGIDSLPDVGEAHNYRSPLKSQNPRCSVLSPVFAKLYKKNLRVLHKTTEFTLIDIQKGNYELRSHLLRVIQKSHRA